MPDPVSATQNSVSPARGAAPTVMRPPGWVNFRALPIRFSKTWSSPIAIRPDAWKIAWDLVLKLERGRRHRGPMSFERIGYDLRDTDVVRRGGQLTRLHACHVEQILDQPVHAEGSLFYFVRRFSEPRTPARPAQSKHPRLHGNDVERGAKIVGDDAQDVITELDRGPGRGIESSIFQRERGPVSELLRQAEIWQPVPAGT